MLLTGPRGMKTCMKKLIEQTYQRLWFGGFAIELPFSGCSKLKTYCIKIYRLYGWNRFEIIITLLIDVFEDLVK